MVLKWIIPSLFLLVCENESLSYVNQDTYMVFDTPVNKANSWFITGGTLYKEGTPFVVKSQKVIYQQTERGFISGVNTLKTDIDLTIFKDNDFSATNKLADFIDSCAEYDLNVILSIKVKKGSEDKIKQLAHFTRPYPNLVGVALTFESPETQLDVQSAAVSILRINSDIMIISKYPIDIPQSKLLRE